MTKSLIAGSTGLIGSQLLQLLLASERYDKVIAVSRRELPSHPKLQVIICDLDSLDQHASELVADDVFCCLGTTIAKAKSRENFLAIDYEYPKRLAQLSHAAGARQFLLVSSLGAHPASRVFYNRVKGQVEDAITQTGFDTTHIFRPSLLLGERKETRSAEDTARVFYRALGFLIPRRFSAIESSKVAAAMLYFASQDKKGNFIHESLALQQF